MTKPIRPTEDNEIDDKSAPQHQEESASVPFWTPEPERPVWRERRKHPAAWHRHEQAKTGVAPPEAVARRQPESEEDDPEASSVRPLWDDSDKN